MRERDNPAETRGDRDAAGRFQAGNGTGKRGGRPPRAVEECYLEAVREAVPLGEWKRAVKAVLDRAIEAGDARSLDLLARYLCPTPEQRTRLSLERPRVERPVAELAADARRLLAEYDRDEEEAATRVAP